MGMADFVKARTVLDERMYRSIHEQREKPRKPQSRAWLDLKGFGTAGECGHFKRGVDGDSLIGGW